MCDNGRVSGIGCFSGKWSYSVRVCVIVGVSHCCSEAQDVLCAGCMTDTQHDAHMFSVPIPILLPSSLPVCAAVVLNPYTEKGKGKAG